MIELTPNRPRLGIVPFSFVWSSMWRIEIKCSRELVSKTLTTNCDKYARVCEVIGFLVFLCALLQCVCVIYMALITSAATVADAAASSRSNWKWDTITFLQCKRTSATIYSCMLSNRICSAVKVEIDVSLHIHTQAITNCIFSQNNIINFQDESNFIDESYTARDKHSRLIFETYSFREKKWPKEIIFSKPKSDNLLHSGQ